MDGDSVAWVLHDEAAMDPALVDWAFPERKGAEAVTTPSLPPSRVRPWSEMPPAMTVLRQVGGRWLVGDAVGIGGSSNFASFREPAKARRAGAAH